MTTEPALFFASVWEGKVQEDSSKSLILFPQKARNVPGSLHTVNSLFLTVCTAHPHTGKLVHYTRYWLVSNRCLLNNC